MSAGFEDAGAATLDPAELERLVAQSRTGDPHTFDHAQDAFQSLARDVASGDPVSPTD